MKKISVLFFWELYGLEIDQENTPISKHDITLTKNPKVVFNDKQELVDLVTLFGEINMENLLNGNTFAFIEKEFLLDPSDSNEKNFEMIKEIGFSFQLSLISFLGDLWFLKDCCASVEYGYIFLRDTKQSSVVKNYSFIYNANGKREIKKITMTDLEKVKEIECLKVDLLDELHTKPKLQDMKGNTAFLNAVKYNSLNRFQRADVLLANARMTSILLSKITLYISFLESLMSSQTSEISHKTAERTAYYLGRNRDEKLGIFEIVKNCYNIRSDYIHGNQLTKKSYRENEALARASIELDDIVRKIMQKIVLGKDRAFITDKFDAENYFNSLLFT